MTSPLAILTATVSAVAGIQSVALSLPALVTYNGHAYQLVETTKHRLTLRAYEGNTSGDLRSVSAAPSEVEGTAM